MIPYRLARFKNMTNNLGVKPAGKPVDDPVEHVRECVRRKLCLVCLSILSLAASEVAMAADVVPVTLPRMTAWSMFLNADWIIKLVMFVLAAASVATWAICIAKYIEFRKTNRALEADQRKLDGAITLETVGSLTSGPGSALLRVARDELSTCIDLGNAKSADAMTERMSVRLGATEGCAVQDMRTGFSVLASIGATSPFIGLFGTVWGIMNSFIGISAAQTTNLAVVAPGIAEALLATALGLVAAIPAVLIYNIFSRQMAGFRRRLHNVSSRVACLVSHETERAQVGHLKVAV